ncbi:peptidoglycan DD-metalloendopeptidase family protein, partial [Gottfriedia acidiceleris]|uniref:murein hydrolase activator EnvC family protein n=1 Tax=Gottfriedia acidiceleris TaxID=371036 RepID=UPI003394A552
IEEKDKQIKVTRLEIVTLQKQIKEIQKRIDQRKEILDERMCSLQKSGGNISYIDIIFGSNSFSDLVQRINAVGTIMQADKAIMQAQRDDLEMVEKKKEDILSNEEKLEKDVIRLKEINQDLSIKVKEKNKLVTLLKQQQHDEEEDVLNLEEQEKLLEEQEKAMKATKNKPRYSNGTSASNSVNLPAVNSGNFTRPADGYISSGYGYRSFDNELHAGIDIVKKGTVPVVSAADGVVIRAYKSSSYGNVVFVSHNIDGKVFTTVYAHMNSYNVSSGQTVSKGQQIGYMGNTGQSFGQHLHFELHAGAWNQSKSNAVDPEKYINF